MTGDLLEWRDTFSTDRQRDYAWSVLMRLISWGRERGMTDRADKIWLPEHIAAFREAASPPLWWALTLALETGQR